jgi:hypothetical protein
MQVRQIRRPGRKNIVTISIFELSLMLASWAPSSAWSQEIHDAKPIDAIDRNIAFF